VVLGVLGQSVLLQNKIYNNPGQGIEPRSLYGEFSSLKSRPLCVVPENTCIPSHRGFLPVIKYVFLSENLITK